MVSETVRASAPSWANLRAHAWIVVAVVALLYGCSAPKRNPVPIEKMATAEMAGMPGVRAWGDEFSPQFQADIEQSVKTTTRRWTASARMPRF